MPYATVPALKGYPEVQTGSPAELQRHVERGAQAADQWLAKPWDDAEPHTEHLRSILRCVTTPEDQAYEDGYMGRIHQHLRTPVADSGQVVACGTDELTHTLYHLVKEAARNAAKGKLKAKSFAARDLLRRIQTMAEAVEDKTDEINAKARGNHDG